ncbi:conserved Plasmodium protein, unknown function [Plasmodium knowlesi strain H]|uniref:Uncharacterized protein n=3 Tax=Plasmodium knowlesi TaxID=5850 RepID=A0A5K1U415_PLAKH|nr:conserved Plasmodium protein, unknown function [Plasmodium knowlesi strain H]OTN64185.1 Uncharacterized protein PKNOH_S140232200 [Plasmodium knowlesi]CAA9990744.1 conserved Plasmodium protein, unknown function [Plasmodium knowlesi strain H]SBO21171.1 conserved Plasmodium protein, unknown function [Plasmodium knowlesi strain H]SBO21628.1 conserved Plasmodium protein, unknown function [Plasmodium knowlesi strain H]VVS80218.1 conserved Plasmodium protein, unknown function [Plasmodium knowlesi |eukprot:XP_002262033.1 hypothetical protein, conserved in Plasmodium species [Plasmodium knowlesi strain H]
MTAEGEQHHVGGDKMMRHLRELEKSYHIMTKEYENITNINTRNNVENIRIIKNLFILNTLIHQVNKKHLMNAFENVENTLIFILKKNNTNFVLKLIAIFYLNLCTYTSYNVRELYGRLFEMTLNRSLVNSPSELKKLHEHFLKNTLLFTSLILAHVHSQIGPHMTALIEYSKKIKKSDSKESRYFYLKCVNKIIKTVQMTPADSEKIYKFLKRQFNEKDELIKYRIIKCVMSMFIVHPEYSLLDFDFFVNCILDDTYLSTCISLVNLIHIIKLLTVIFCNCTNVSYKRSINDHGAGRSRIGKAEEDAFIRNGATDEDDEEEEEDDVDIEEREEGEDDQDHEEKESYAQEKEKKRNNKGSKTTNVEGKKKSFFSDFLKIATDEIVSKISNIKLEEKEGGKNYIKLEHVDGFLFLSDNLFNKKFVRNKKSVLFVYDFPSFLVFFKKTLLNMFSDYHHDYTELKKLHFLRKLEKYTYYADVLNHFGTNVYTPGKGGDAIAVAGKVYEFFRKQKKGSRMRGASSVSVGEEASDSDTFINYLLEKDYKLMKEKEQLRYDDLQASIEEKKILKTYYSLIRNTLLRSIFFQSFKNLLSFSKKFSGKSIIKIIKLFLHLLDVACTNCAKKKNLKNRLHTNNITNSFEINFLLFYFTDIVQQLVREKKRDTYTIVKEKEYKAKEREKWKMDDTNEYDDRAERTRIAHEEENEKRQNSSLFCEQIDQKGRTIVQSNTTQCGEKGTKNFEQIGTTKSSDTHPGDSTHGGENDSNWYNRKSSTSSQNGMDSSNSNKRYNEFRAIKGKNRTKEEEKKIEEDNKVRVYIQNQVKNYLIRNNDTNMDVNEKKKYNILLKGLIILYNKIIVNNSSIKKDKYNKYESFLKIILNNMNGVHIDIDLVRHIIHLFVKVFLKFPQYTYNLITLLVNYITIINANFMTSLTLNTFDDIEKQVSILIISSVSLEKILYSSCRFYRLYHLNNLILCVFDICKLFLSKVQTHPLKTINEMRRIISFSLIHAISSVVVYEEVRNRRTVQNCGQIDAGERISEMEPCVATTQEKMQEIFDKHEQLYDNILFKLLTDILREMLNEIEKEKMQCFISSYEEQIKKKKMNSSNFFIVDNLFILVYILKTVHTILASDILTFLFFDHIYKIVQTLFDFLRQVYQVKKDHYDKGSENYEVQVPTITSSKKRKEKSATTGSYSKKEGTNSFHFFEYGFTQMCRLINIENVFLIFLIYMLKIFCRVFKFVKHKFGKGAKTAGSSEYVALGRNGTNIGIKSVEERSPCEGNYREKNYKQDSSSSGTTIVAMEEVTNTTVNAATVTVPMKKPFTPIWEALIEAKSFEGTPFNVFLDLLIYLVKNKDKDNFNNAVINILQRGEENHRAKKKRKEGIKDIGKRKRQLYGEEPELDVLYMLTNHYEVYYELVLIHFVQLFQLCVEKKKYFNVIIKNIYRCILNVELNKNELIIYLLILDKFLKTKFFNKKKGKIFKCMLPIFNVLNSHFVNKNSGLLNALLIKNLTHFICQDDNIDSYIFSYVTKFYQAYSRQILQEKYLCVIFSIFLKSVILSYIKIEDNNSYVVKNVTSVKKENSMSNLEGAFPSSNLSVGSFCSSTFLDTPSSTPSRKVLVDKGRATKKIKPKKATFTLANFRTLDLCQPLSFSGRRMRRSTSRRINHSKFYNRSEKGKLTKYSNSGLSRCTQGKISHVDKLANDNLFNEKKGKILEFFDTYLNMLKVIAHDNKVFSVVLRNFNVVIRRMHTRVNLCRIKDCLYVVLAYILKAENTNTYRFEVNRGGCVIELFNNLLRILRKGGMRIGRKGDTKLGVKKGHKLPTRKKGSTEMKLSTSQRQMYSEVESHVVNIFELFLTCYEKKTDRRLFTTINIMFRLVKKKKLEKFMNKISILIQRNIFLQSDKNKIQVAIKCLCKLSKRKIQIPLSDNFDYHLLVIYNHHSGDMLNKCFTEFLKMRIQTYGFYNVSQWIKLFDRILNSKNMFLYDLIKYRSKGRYAKYERSDCNKNLSEHDATKENNLLTNEKQPSEELKDSVTFHTSLFSKHFSQNRHINLQEENEEKGGDRVMYFFNVFKLRQSDFTFSFDTKYLVMKLLLFFLKTVSLSPLVCVHNDAYYVSYVKRRLKKGILNVGGPANGQEKHMGGRIRDARSLNGAARKGYRKEGSPRSNGKDSGTCTRRSHDSDSSCNDLVSAQQSSTWNKMNKPEHIPPGDNFLLREGKHMMKDKISYIEDVLIRKKCSKEEIKFNNVDIESVVENFSLYDNIEQMLNIILHNINYGIRFEKLSRLAIKALILFLKIFKSSKIILDEFSTNHEIILLANYEINIFTSLKMYYESFHFLYFSYLEGDPPRGGNNSDLVGDKPNEYLQFSHFFLKPLMRVYNLFLLLNEIGLCNSHSKFVEYFFYFAVKGSHAVREELADSTVYVREKSDMINGNISMDGHDASNGDALAHVSGRKKIPTINSSLFFSEFDSSVYYLFSYKAFCLYIINSEKAQRNLGNFNIKTVVKNISYILYDTIVMYFWSFGHNREGGEKDFQDQVVHRFFTCMNDKARSLSIFYFSAFVIFLQFLNVIRRSNELIISAKNCTLYKTLIYFLCYHLKEHKDKLKEETKEIYFSFIFGYLSLTGFVSDLSHDAINSISDQGDIIPNETQLSSSVAAENREKKSDRIENSSKSNGGGDMSKPSSVPSEIVQDSYNASRISFLKTILDYVLKHLVMLVNEKVLPSVLEFVSVAHEHFANVYVEGGIHNGVIGKVFTLHLFVLGMFLKKRRYGDKRGGGEFRSVHDGDMLTLLWNSVLSCYALLERLEGAQLEEGKAEEGKAEDGKAEEGKVEDGKSADAEVMDAEATGAKKTEDKMAQKIRGLLQALFLEKMKLLKEEKLSTRLLKLFFQKCRESDLQNYLIHMKSYKGEIAKIVKEQDLPRLKLFYIKVIIFIHFINTTDMMNRNSKVHYTEEILNVFITASRRMKMTYHNIGIEMRRRNISSKKREEGNGHTKNQIIHSFLNAIKNIFTLLLKREDSIVSYFTHNLIKNDMLPILMVNHCTDNLQYEELVAANSWEEDIITYPVKILNSFFDTFISREALLRKIIIPYITFVHQVCRLCDAKRVDITKSFFTIQADGDEMTNPLSVDEGSSCPQKCFSHAKVIRTESGTTTVYFKEVTNLFRNIAFKNASFFKNILTDISAEEKVMVYNLIKEAIAAEKHTEQRSKQEKEKLDFSFVN